MVELGKNNQGFSLIEMLVVVAVGATVMIGMSSMFRYNMQSSIAIEIRNEINQLDNQIISRIQDSQLCRDFIGDGQNYTAYDQDSGSEPKNNLDLRLSGTLKITPGDPNLEKFGSHLIVKQVYLWDVQNVSADRYTAELRVHIDRPDNSMGADRINIYRLNFIDPAGGPSEITDCWGASQSGVAELEDYCYASLGGVWDSATQACDLSMVSCLNSGGAYDSSNNKCDMCPSIGQGAFDSATGTCCGLSGTCGAMTPPPPSEPVCTAQQRAFCNNQGEVMGLLCNCCDFITLKGGTPGYCVDP